MNNILLFISRLNFLFPYRLGPDFIRYRKFFRDNFYKYDNSADLLRSVNYSLKNIPYFQKLGIGEIKSIEEFKNKIPFTDKDIMMANWDDFVLPGYPKNKAIDATTGGTSGKPLRLLIPKSRYVYEQNTINALWGNIGWNGEIRGVIRNHHLDKGQVFKVNPLKKEVIFDGFNTDEGYYEEVYNTLRRFNISYIHAYPSSAYQFSLFLKKTKKDIRFLKGFLSGSEGLTDLQRNLIVEDLGLKIYNWYGHSEKVVLGGPCSGSDLIHIEPTYGYFELIDESGNPITEIGKVGEITGTGLHNPYMSFIRYRTGDYAEYAGDYCPHCKRHIQLIKEIQGRRESNRIYLMDGSYTSITALNLHSDLYNYIDGMQYIQEKEGELKIYLIKGTGFNGEIESQYREHFTKSLHGKCDFEFVFTNELQYEANGKFLPLKQLIKKDI